MNRSSMRELAFKAMYGMEIQKEYTKEQLELFLEDNEITDEVAVEYITSVYEGIEKNKYKVEKATNRMAQGIKEGFNLNGLNNEIMREMNKAVAIETGSINATASVKANNSMLSVIKATFNIDGSVNMDGKKVGRTIAPSVVKTIKTGGLA